MKHICIMYKFYKVHKCDRHVNIYAWHMQHMLIICLSYMCHVFTCKHICMTYATYVNYMFIIYVSCVLTYMSMHVAIYASCKHTCIPQIGTYNNPAFLIQTEYLQTVIQCKAYYVKQNSTAKKQISWMHTAETKKQLLQRLLGLLSTNCHNFGWHTLQEICNGKTWLAHLTWFVQKQDHTLLMLVYVYYN